MKLSKIAKRDRRHRRIKMKIHPSLKRPRLVVYRSLNKNYAQLVDDKSGKVLIAVNDSAFEKEGTKTMRAKKVGLELAKKASEKGITSCIFDRRGYKYHGRIKALAEGAREGGMKF